MREILEFLFLQRIVICIGRPKGTVQRESRGDRVVGAPGSTKPPVSHKSLSSLNSTESLYLRCRDVSPVTWKIIGQDLYKFRGKRTDEIHHFVISKVTPNITSVSLRISSQIFQVAIHLYGIVTPGSDY